MWWSKYLSLVTGLNRMALHSSEFAVTTKNNNNLSLSVTDQHYRYVSMKIYSSLEAPGNCPLSPLNNASSFHLQQVLAFGKLIETHLGTNSHANSCFLWVCRGRWTCYRTITHTTFFLWRQSSQKRREDRSRHFKMHSKSSYSVIMSIRGTFR